VLTFDRPIVVSTEMPVAKTRVRIGLRVFYGAFVFLFTGMTIYLVGALLASGGDSTKLLANLAMYALSFGSVCVLYKLSLARLKMGLGTWTISNDGLSFQSREGARTELAWEDITKIRLDPQATFFFGGAKKIWLPWGTFGPDGASAQNQVYKVLRARFEPRRAKARWLLNLVTASFYIFNAAVVLRVFLSPDWTIFPLYGLVLLVSSAKAWLCWRSSPRWRYPTSKN
jgi:hypothetical protein